MHTGSSHFQQMSKASGSSYHICDRYTLQHSRWQPLSSVGVPTKQSVTCSTKLREPGAQADAS